MRAMPGLALDLHSFIRAATYILLFFGLYALWRGRGELRSATDLPYVRVRQQRIMAGWRGIFVALLLFLGAAWFGFYGERTAYAVFPVTATPTLSPTATLSPTPSLTPSQTLTPSITPTPEFTPIPRLPASVLAEFTSMVTPNPAAVFSPFTFARGINPASYAPVQPGGSFANPVSAIYAIFSYDQMLPGVQWTALWYRDGELVHYETKPWDGGSGGLGYTEWIADAEDWLPGVYQVQMFVGEEAKLVGEFEVTGQPATSTPTRTPTPLPTATHTRQPTATSP